MITRAISLLIIIGDHQTLTNDRNWKEVIDYVQKNHALIQGGKHLHPRVRAP